MTLDSFIILKCLQSSLPMQITQTTLCRHICCLPFHYTAVHTNMAQRTLCGLSVRHLWIAINCCVIIIHFWQTRGFLHRDVQGPSTQEMTPVKIWMDHQHEYIERNQIVHALRKDLHIPIQLYNYGNYTVRVVYFVNCKVNPNYDSWIRGQMDYLPLPYRHPNFGITELYLIASSHNCKAEERLQSAFTGLSARLSWAMHLSLECHTEAEETYEHHGIEKAWELGQLFSNLTDIVIYFHSKGLTHTSAYLTPGYTKPLLENMDRVEEAFNLFPTIDKIGIQSGGVGWIWYNFWYVRGSYLNRVERPLRTKRRHYYEDWLSRVDGPFPRPQSPNASELPLISYPNTLISCYALGYDNFTEYPHIGVILDTSDWKDKPFEVVN